MVPEGLSQTGSSAGDDESAKLIAKDRLKAIIHEVGHLTLALALGYPAQISLRATNTDDAANEKTWVGSCRVNYSCRSRTNRTATMIALAGWMAELLHEQPDADVAEELRNDFQLSLSDTDLDHVTFNKRWLITWGEETAAILTQFAAFREWAAARLSEHRFISENEAIKAFPSKRKFARYLAVAQQREKQAQQAMNNVRRSADAPDS